MPIYELNRLGITPIQETTFHASGWRERDDLQRFLRDQIELISPETLVIAEEFGGWDESSRRIDLLGIDKQANLVVIELKRTQDGGHMDLQAIRYAAMVSTMTFDQAASVFADYLAGRDANADARQILLDHLQWTEPNQADFAPDVRIVLASAEFSKELTTAVLWLNERGLDMRCVRIKPYRDGERTLIDIQPVLPLPEAEDYTVRVREKASVVRESRREKGKGGDGSWFVNIGMDDPASPAVEDDGKAYTRHWDYCRRFGYVSAGWAERFRDYMMKLQPGDRIYAYVKGRGGYVGYGEVIATAVPLHKFLLADGTPLAEQLDVKHVNRGRKPEEYDYAVGIRWDRTFDLSEGKRYVGIFAPITAVCRISDDRSLEFLKSHFQPSVTP